MAILGYNTVAFYGYDLTASAVNNYISNRYDSFAGASGTATVIKCYVDPFSGVCDFKLALQEWNGSNWVVLDEVTITGVASTGTSTPFLISGAISATITSGNSYRVTCLGSNGYKILYDDTGSGPVGAGDIASYDNYFASFAFPATMSNANFTDYTGVQSTLWVEYTTGGGAGLASPPAGGITITGQAPTVKVSDNKKASPAAGNITISGNAPVVKISDHKKASPPSGTVSITGLAPIVRVSDHKKVTPGSGEIIILGLAPTVRIGNDQKASPGAGNINITGIAPIVRVSNNQVVRPPSGEITVAGIAPIIRIGGNIKVTPGAGEITIQGLAPIATGDRAGSVIHGDPSGTTVIRATPAANPSVIFGPGSPPSVIK